MRFLKFLAIHFCRFVASILSQWFFFLIFGIVYYWNRFVLPDKIHAFFSIEDLKEKVDLAAQATEFMKQMASVTNPTAYLNYTSSLVNKTILSSRLQLMQTFDNISQFVLSGLINIALICLLVYIVIRVFRVYKQKTYQRESVRLITRELMPKLEDLNQEIKALRAELKALKDDKQNRLDDSTKPRG